ncbi:MAG: non-ribosomal peptide synthetase, partial [Verrucomicrobiota bacterium]
CRYILIAGASLHLPDETSRSTPARLVEWIAEEKLTVCWLITPLGEAVMNEPWPEDGPFRLLQVAGDILHRAPEKKLPFELRNLYGPTEYTVCATGAEIPSGIADDTPPPIGRPIHNTEVYVLDERQQPVPIGVAGELHIGGAGLTRGYRNQPERTREKFIEHPFRDDPDARLYKTGDLVRYRSDGQIEFLGRIDHQVKIRGYRIEPGEIETHLAGHADIHEAVAVAREFSPGDVRLVAYFITHGSPPTDLREFLSQRLPAYMIPSHFVEVERFPLTPSGKIDRKALPPPEPKATPAERATGAEPTSPMETLVGEIWQEVLGLDEVDRLDNFFDLGGDSMLAMQVLAELEKQTGVVLKPADLMLQTLGQLAATCEAEPVKARKTPIGKRLKAMTKKLLST